MRFHHSTRRGRTKFSQGGGPHHRVSGGGPAASHSSVSNRWAQLSYCRQTSIHFNRRLPVEVPESARRETLATGASPLSGSSQINCNENWPPSPTAQQSNGIERQMGELQLASPQRGVKTLPGSTTRSGAASKRVSMRHQQQQQQQKRSLSISSSTSGAETAPEAPLNSTNANHDQQHHDAHDHDKFKKLDIELAREKLIAQVEKHPFWSNKAAKRMRLLDLVERRIFIYELVSYCEKRDLEWRYEPYRGGLVAGTGPFVGTSAGVRRVLSSTSAAYHGPTAAATAAATATATATSDTHQSGNLLNFSDADSGLSGSSLHNQQAARTGHRSQPGSPLVLGAGAQFAYETDERGQLTPPSMTMISVDQNGKPTTTTTSDQQQQKSARQRQAIRRSCSSAATSPSHSGNTAAAHSQLTSQSSFQVGPDSPTATGSLAWGEPRPLPSAELVWSIEPPAHLKPAPFSSYIHTSEVPDTSFVKRCHGCQGRGRLKCTSCYGVGYEVCISCSGKGTMKSLASPLSQSAGGAASSHHHNYGRHNGAASDSATLGSMWSNASECESRLGSGRHEEPGGISGGSGGSGATSSSSAWTTESCHFCHGAGQKRCWICAGRSYNTCTACAGTGQLRCYLNLNITWMNHRDECVLNNADSIIPRDRLKLSSGLLLADEVALRLAPLAPSSGGAAAATHTSTTTSGRTQDGAPLSPLRQQSQSSSDAPQPAHRESAQTSPTTNGQNGGGGSATSARRNSNSPRKTPAISGQPLDQLVRPAELSQLQSFSAKLLDKHAVNYERSERLLRQRHRVTQIECHLVNWEWKRRRGHFVIYGDERKVYIAKYPFKSICNIT